ncbi:MAG TPA: hypothetical protein VI521_01785 [Candidatus Babeliales bacterium]|nr:hypothetical protein [Candidatus Babeliales bacterium]
MNKTYPFSIARTVVIISVSKAFSLLKMSMAVGAFWTVFSLRGAIAPLVGAFGGIAGAGTLFASTMFSALFLKNTVAFSSLAYSGIPTLCASLYWAFESRIARSFIPALCMILFVMHPQGMMAAPYALFWLIPIIIAYREYNSVFLTALGSTFTAHAVGSVLWLYSTGMGAEYWYSLLPVVPAERVLFAAVMTAGHMVFSYLFSYSFGFASRARTHS